MRRKLNDYAGVLALAALVAAVSALCVGGAIAGSVLVGSKQIKNGSILTQDIHKGGVKSSDVQNGTIGSADIGNGEVEPQDVEMPAPEQLKEGDVATIVPTTDFAVVDIVGAYAKEDPSSILQIDWIGTVKGEAGGELSGCVFQIRVDGQPVPGGGGEVFGKGVVSVSVTALFPGLAVGSHQIEVWARKTLPNSAFDSCTVGPAAAGIGQTFVVSEQVI